MNKAKQAAMQDWANAIDVSVRAHLQPRLDVQMEWDLRRQVYLLTSRWHITQSMKDSVMSMFDVMSNQDEDGNSLDEPAFNPVMLSGETCASFDRYLEHMERDAELWRALQAKRQNRWWRRLWRKIDWWAHERFSGS